MYRYTKANLFNQHLIEKDMRNGFNVIESEEYVVFTIEPTINGSKCEILIAISDNIETEILYTFTTLGNMAKADNIIRLLNELNGTYKMKYVLNENGNIQATFDYISMVETFNPDLLLSYVVSRFQHIEQETYPKIMKVMWN